MGTLPQSMELRTASIVLDRMPQQEKIQTPDDDWTGQSNRAERKRRQNRLNQRAYRKRKEAQAAQVLPYHAHRISPISYLDESSPDFASDEAAYVGRARIDHDPQDIGPWQAFSTAIASTEPQFLKLSQVAVTFCKTDESNKTIRQFQKWVARNHMTGSPTADHVLVLIKFNIFRALCNNAMMLGFPIEFTMGDDALSPFTNALSPFTPKSKYEQHLVSPERLLEIPGNLRPTSMQCEIPHHPWIDLLPVPQMRDNLILAEDTYDGGELCEALCGLFNSSNSTAQNGLIIWGDPWDPAGWEVTPQFLQRWAWTVDGCTELLASTNYWRQRRGEKPLRFERVFQGVVDEIP